MYPWMPFPSRESQLALRIYCYILLLRSCATFTDQPGATYDDAKICKSKGIKDSRNHPSAICCVDLDLPDTVALKELQKNGCAWMVEIILQFFPKGYTEDPDKINQKVL